MAREESCNLDKEEAEILKLKHPPSSSSSSPSLFNKSASQEPPVQRPKSPQPSDADPRPVVAASGPEKSGEAEANTPVRYASRCSSCRRRVGLTGFRCRCGDLFCGRHRYSDTHDCSFDYKAAGREEISKANPLIRAAKIIKI